MPALLLTLALLVPLVGACDRGPETDPTLGVGLAVSPTPPAEGPARVVVVLRDSLGGPLSDAEVTVTGLMEHAGMQPVRDTAIEVFAGSYVVPEFDFHMAGDWVLEVRALAPDGRRAALDRRVRVVSRPGGA